MSYIVDTYIMNRLIDGTFVIDELPSDYPFAAARVQIDQIRKTRDKGLKARLLLKFGKYHLKRISIGSIILDGSYWEDFKLWNHTLFRDLTDDFRQHCHSQTNARDILLAEVAISNGLTLLTADECLAEVVRRHGGEASYVAAAA